MMRMSWWLPVIGLFVKISGVCPAGFVVGVSVFGLDVTLWFVGVVTFLEVVAELESENHKIKSTTKLSVGI